MVSVKEGLGGHGMQAYSTEDGKYVEVSVSLNGESAKNFEEFLGIAKKSDRFMAKWNQDPELAEGRLFGIYRSKFMKEVEDINQSEIERFDGADDFYGNMDKAFNWNMVWKLKEYCKDGYGDYIEVSPYRDGEQNSLKVAIFNGRFGTPKMNHMRESEFVELYKSDEIDKRKTMEQYRWSRDGAKDMKDYLKGLPKGKGVAFFRCLKRIEDGKETDVVRGYYEKSSPVISNVSEGGAGSGIYVSPTITIKDADVDFGYFNEGNVVMIHGIIKDASSLRIAPSSNWYHGNDKDMRAVNSLQRMSGEKEFREKMASTLREKGFSDDGEACRRLARNISDMIGQDFGIAAAMLGYDMMTGYGNEMVILNPRIAYMSSTWHNKQTRR